MLYFEEMTDLYSHIRENQPVGENTKNIFNVALPYRLNKNFVIQVWSESNTPFRQHEPHYSYFHWGYWYSNDNCNNWFSSRPVKYFWTWSHNKHNHLLKSLFQWNGLKITMKIMTYYKCQHQLQYIFLNIILIIKCHWKTLHTQHQTHSLVLSSDSPLQSSPIYQHPFHLTCWLLSEKIKYRILL